MPSSLNATDDLSAWLRTAHAGHPGKRLRRHKQRSHRERRHSRWSGRLAPRLLGLLRRSRPAEALEISVVHSVAGQLAGSAAAVIPATPIGGLRSSTAPVNCTDFCSVLQGFLRYCIDLCAAHCTRTLTVEEPSGADRETDVGAAGACPAGAAPPNGRWRPRSPRQASAAAATRRAALRVST